MKKLFFKLLVLILILFSVINIVNTQKLFARELEIYCYGPGIDAHDILCGSDPGFCCFWFSSDGSSGTSGCCS